MKKLIYSLLLAGVMLAGCQTTQLVINTPTPDPNWPTLDTVDNIVIVQPKSGGELRLASLTNGQTWSLSKVLPTSYEWENVFYNPWSPDGYKLILIARSSLAISLHLVDIKSRTVTKLYESKHMYRVQQIYWSRDGKHVLFTEQVDIEPYQDKLMSLDIATGKSEIR